MNKNTEKIDPNKVQRWIKLVIAILAAIAGAIAENATSVVGSIASIFG